MTQSKALELLKNPQFGNPEHIKAVKVLLLYQELQQFEKDAHLDCPKCEGNSQKTCPECDGTGLIDCPECDGSGSIIALDPYSDYSLKYLRESLQKAKELAS